MSSLFDAYIKDTTRCGADENSCDACVHSLGLRLRSRAAQTRVSRNLTACRIRNACGCFSRSRAGCVSASPLRAVRRRSWSAACGSSPASWPTSAPPAQPRGRRCAERRRGRPRDRGKAAVTATARTLFTRERLEIMTKIQPKFDGQSNGHVTNRQGPGRSDYCSVFGSRRFRPGTWRAPGACVSLLPCTCSG